MRPQLNARSLCGRDWRSASAGGQRRALEAQQQAIQDRRRGRTEGGLVDLFATASSPI